MFSVILVLYVQIMDYLVLKIIKNITAIIKILIWVKS